MRVHPDQSVSILRLGAPPGAEEELRVLAESLQGTPRAIPSRFFYDERGSQLFEAITELPEYYPSRTEAALLEAISGDIAALCRPHELLELGSGASVKTRVLLRALRESEEFVRYLPMDIDEAIIRRVAGELTHEFPGLEVQGLVGDFSSGLEFPPGERRLMLFLGGTLGNFRPPQAREFLARLARGMAEGDHLLLGLDRIKDVKRLEAAYNDSLGVTAEFNRNILRSVNARAGGNFDPEAYEHRAFYEREKHRIEMWLVPSRPQTVRLERLDLTFELDSGEAIRTEVSTKYDSERLEAILDGTGLELEAWHTGAEDLFALCLLRRGPLPSS